MTTSAGSVQLDLTANTAQFERQANAAAGRVSGAFKKAFAAVSVTAGVAALGKFATSALEAASNLNEVQNVVDVAFPKMNAQLNEWAVNAANSFGLSETMAKKYAGLYGSMSSAFGFAEDEAYSMATTLAGLAGDVASFYNIDQDLAYTKLKSVFSGETETLKDLGIVMTQNALDAYALANGYGATVQQMSEAEKVSLRYAFVQDQLRNATGDFTRTQGSWANQTRILALNWQQFLAGVGQGFIAVFLPVVKGLNAIIVAATAATKTFQRFIEAVTGKRMAELVGGATDAGAAVMDLGGATNDAAISTGDLAKSQDKATKAAKAQDKAVKDLNRTLAGFDKINKLSSNKDSLGAASMPTVSAASVPDLSGVSTGLGDAIAAEADKAQKAIDKITIPPRLAEAINHFRTAWERLSDVIGGAFKWVWENILQPLAKWTINELAPRIIEMVANAMDTLAIVGEKLAPIFKVIWEEIFQPLFKFLGEVAVGALDLINKGWEKFNKLIDKADFTEFSENIRGVVSLFKGPLVTAWELAKTHGETFFVKIIKPLAEFLSGAFKKAIEAGKTAIDALRKVFGTVQEAGGTFYDKVLKPVGEILVGAFKKGLDAGKAAIDALKKVFDAIHDAGAKFYDKVLKPIAEFFGGLFKKNTDEAKASVKGFSDVWGVIKSKTVELATKGIDAAKEVASGFKTTWAAIKSKTVELVAKAKDAASDVITKAKFTLGEFGKTVATATLKAANKVGEGVTAAKEWLKEKFASFTTLLKSKNSVGEGVVAAKTWLKEKFASWTTSLFCVNKVGDGVAKAKASLANFKSKGVNLYGTNKVWEAVNKAKNSLAGFKSKGVNLYGTNRVWEAVNKAKNSLAAFKGKTVKLSASFNVVKTPLNNAMARIEAGLRRFHINASLPRFATGGYVGRNTPMLAVIGDNTREGEIVSPESKLQTMLDKAVQMGGGDAQTAALLSEILAAIRGLDTNVYLDGNDITRAVVSRVNKQTQTTGISPILV